MIILLTIDLINMYCIFYAIYRTDLSEIIKNYGTGGTTHEREIRKFFPSAQKQVHIEAESDDAAEQSS